VNSLKNARNFLRADLPIGGREKRVWTEKRTPRCDAPQRRSQRVRAVVRLFVECFVSRKKFLFRAILLALLSLVYSGSTDWARAGSAVLSWTVPTTNTDGSALTDLAGYKIYYGTVSGVYGAPIDAGSAVGSPPGYTVNNLGIGTYYFAVTAYDTAGRESAFSNETSKTFAAPGGPASLLPGPSSASNPLASSVTSVTGGCGMISLKGGQRTGPSQSADMFAIVGIMIVLLIRKSMRSTDAESLRGEFSDAKSTHKSVFPNLDRLHPPVKTTWFFRAVHRSRGPGAGSTKKWIAGHRCTLRSIPLTGMTYLIPVVAIDVSRV